MTTPQQEETPPVKTNKMLDVIPLQQKSSQSPTTTNSTNKIILDHLLYRSIQSRLKQAQYESLEIAPSLQTQNKDILQEQKQHWVDIVTLAEQDKKAVESVVKGMLSNHRSKRPSFQIDAYFEQRLHLCQLTNLIFGRRDNDDMNENTCIQWRRRHHHHQHQYHLHQRLHQHQHQHQQQQQRDDGSSSSPSEHITTTTCRWTHTITPHHCRRHRLQSCDICPGLIHPPLSTFPPGLLEAIPTFLKTSADLLRRTLETHSDDNNNNKNNKKKPMIFAGQKVMGGGMPPRWYDLFLELLTQAAIECYLCDMQTGLESIYEIFSYGDVEDEDEPEHSLDDDDDDDDDDEDDDNDDYVHHHNVLTKNDEDEDDDDDDWSVEAADHHLLFPKTRTMYLFKTQVREREKEILAFEDNVTLHQHFQALAKRYPLDNFEKNMGEYIQMIHHTMTIPDLDSKDDENTTSVNISNTIKNGTSIYKYPGDGSLLMPELPEEEEDDDITTSDQQQALPSNKRRASVDLEKPDASKKHE